MGVPKVGLPQIIRSGMVVGLPWKPWGEISVGPFCVFSIGAMGLLSILEGWYHQEANTHHVCFVLLQIPSPT